MREMIIDSFAGGSGASLGIVWATGSGPDVAINHDFSAMEMHKTNHPEPNSSLKTFGKLNLERWSGLDVLSSFGRAQTVSISHAPP